MVEGSKKGALMVSPTNNFFVLNKMFYACADNRGFRKGYPAAFLRFSLSGFNKKNIPFYSTGDIVRDYA